MVGGVSGRVREWPDRPCVPALASRASHEKRAARLGQREPLQITGGVGFDHFGVGTASVRQGNQSAIGGSKLVGADTERSRQRPSHVNQEATGSARLRSSLGHRRIRAELATIPTFGSGISTIDGQHPCATETHFPAGPPARFISVDDGVDLIGSRETGGKTGIVRWSGQHISHAKVTGPNPIAPWDPLRGQ